MYGDFQCPYCTAAQSIVRRVRERLDGRLRFAFRHLPLHEVHPDAAARRRGGRGRRRAGRVLGDARRAVRQRRPLAGARTWSRWRRGSGSTSSASAPSWPTARYAARVARDADAARAAGVAGDAGVLRQRRAPRRARSTPARWSRHSTSRSVNAGPTTLAPPCPRHSPCSPLSSPCSSPPAAAARRGRAAATRSANVPDENGIRESVQAAADADRDRVPARRGQDARSELADRMAAGPSLALASSVFTSPGDNRMAFGVIAEDGTPVYGPTAVYVAPTPGAPAEGPFVAPADVLLTEPRYRSKQAATETEDPFVAVYARRREVRQARPVRRAGRDQASDGGSSARPGRSGLDQGRRPGPGRRREGAEGRTPTRSRPPRATSRRSTRASRRATCTTSTSPTSSARSRSRCCSPRRSCAQSRVCGPVTDIALQMQAKYGDQMDFIHQEVYVDNDAQQGPARAAASSSTCRREPWLFVVDKNGKITARLEGSIGVAAVRGRGQVRPVRRALAVLAAALAAAVLVPAVAEAHGLVQRQQLPIPQWLFAWAAAAVLVISFFALAVLWPQPRLERDDWRAAARRRGARRAAAAGAVGRDRRRAAGRHDPRRLPRQRHGAGQLGADVPADHVLGRAGVRLDPVRRRLPRVQPVPRARARCCRR